ncbi:MAG: hypothetical protein HY923_03195 [Elusimicrobia bacterium]|nr:hypothetical protein [Elusimicrobiota bacterium]
MSERDDRLLAGGVFAFVVAVFLPALSFSFLNWDDFQNVAANPLLRFDRPGLAFMLSGSKLGHWQPLTWLSFALDRLIWGDGPFGHHLMNVLIHAAGAVALFFLARRLKVPALFAALFWALHPLRVESVAWITERRDVLCGLLSICAALTYVDGKHNPSRRRLALLLTALAMTAKVFAVVLPAVWLVLDVRLEGKPRWREKLEYLPFALVALAVNIVAQAGSGAAVSFADFGVAHRLAQSFYNLAFYPWKTLAPLGLAPLYERSVLLEPLPFSLAATSVLTAVALLVVYRRRAPGLVLAVLAYAILLLPALGLFKSGRMTAADRWSYLPSIPLSLLAAGMLGRGLDRNIFRPVAGAVIIALAVLTRLQLPVWSSDVALWTKAVEASPLSSFALERLADAEQAAGRPGEADGRRAHAKTMREFVLGLSSQIR